MAMTVKTRESEAAAHKRGWTPRLRGSIYCSPLCGGNCKKSEFDNATKAAAKLAKTMGEGWEPRVWENLGWHYSVGKGIGCWPVMTPSGSISNHSGRFWFAAERPHMNSEVRLE